MKIYVLAGKAQSGKDTVANIIKEYHSEKKVLIYSSTMYLKRYVSMIYGWNGEENTKPRNYLQSLGNKIRSKYPNIFITRIKEDIKYLSNYFDIIIVTGVRLVSELNCLKEIGSTIIKIEKDTNTLTEDQKKDITETDVDNYHNYDYIINNDGTIEELKQKTIKILEETK